MKTLLTILAIAVLFNGCAILEIPDCPRYNRNMDIEDCKECHPDE